MIRIYTVYVGYILITPMLAESVKYALQFYNNAWGVMGCTLC